MIGVVKLHPYLQIGYVIYIDQVCDDLIFQFQSESVTCMFQLIFIIYQIQVIIHLIIHICLFRCIPEYMPAAGQNRITRTYALK